MKCNGRVAAHEEDDCSEGDIDEADCDEMFLVQPAAAKKFVHVVPDTISDSTDDSDHHTMGWLNSKNKGTNFSFNRSK